MVSVKLLPGTLEEDFEFIVLDAIYEYVEPFESIYTFAEKRQPSPQNIYRKTHRSK